MSYFKQWFSAGKTWLRMILIIDSERKMNFSLDDVVKSFSNWIFHGKTLLFVFSSGNLAARQKLFLENCCDSGKIVLDKNMRSTLHRLAAF